jgi:hypothetical protein
MVTVESELGEEERSVRFDERSVSLDAVTDSATTRLEPSSLAVCLFECLRCQIRVASGSPGGVKMV